MLHLPVLPVSLHLLHAFIYTSALLLAAHVLS